LSKGKGKRMVAPVENRVALVGTGIIGRGWIYVFTGAGCRTRIYDSDPLQIQKVLAWFKQTLKQDVNDGFLSAEKAESQMTLVSAHEDLRSAVQGAAYIQESGPERLDIKQSIFAQMDQTADPTAIIASSTSSLDINEITTDLPGIHRCILAHPFNPPHVIPAVEVMPTKQTDPKVTQQTIDFLKTVGQKPLLMNFYTPGYLFNRIQAAVVREAIHIVESGLCDVNAVDTAIRDGLGLRWALLGNFGTNNTNADGGVREYYARYGSVYTAIMNDLDSSSPSFSPEMIERIGQAVDTMEKNALPIQICLWRDRMVRKIRSLKDEDLHP